MIWIALWIVAAVVFGNCWVMGKVLRDIEELKRQSEDDLK